MYIYICSYLFDASPIVVYCSIIYQRGLYPSDQFGKVKKYGLTLLMAQDENVKKFITGVTTQLSGTWSYITNSVSRIWYVNSPSSATLFSLAWNWEVAAGCPGYHRSSNLWNTWEMELRYWSWPRGSWKRVCSSSQTSRTTLISF